MGVILDFALFCPSLSRINFQCQKNCTPVPLVVICTPVTLPNRESMTRRFFNGRDSSLCIIYPYLHASHIYTRTPGFELHTSFRLQ